MGTSACAGVGVYPDTQCLHGGVTRSVEVKLTAWSEQAGGWLSGTPAWLHAA